MSDSQIPLPPADAPAAQITPKQRSLAMRLLIYSCVVIFGLAFSGLLVVAFAIIMAYPNLPEIDAITSYRPKMPMRVFSADNVLIAEFGEERRNVVHFADIPEVMKKAVLAIEDDRFYEHGGVDYIGITRAALNNVTSGNKQGASTITQQVARNFFLSTEQTVKRKIYEILLAWKIEQNLTKNQILEVYMNQIYLGQRAYGFSSAAQIYFGKELKEITVAEAAMLAGLPKAPSAYNPVANPKRAAVRQQYILQRMKQLGYITEAQFEAAKTEKLRIKTNSAEFGIHAEYIAEMARLLVYEQFKEETYTRGLNVYTTVSKEEQEAAYTALRKGVMDYERRHGYRGPEAIIELPRNKEAAEEAIEKELADHPDSDDILAAMVLDANPTLVRAVLANGDEIQVTGPGLSFAASGLKPNAPANKRIQRGAVIRVMRDGKNWSVIQMPEVQSAFVAADTNDGAIHALVGGFD
ncbi:MAG: transglycosylase domain-containing protein, partial [Burkholderiales bacterium]|nr:transglycosylase domain-containing protein [Burkholderiales bacterium]